MKEIELVSERAVVATIYLADKVSVDPLRTLADAAALNINQALNNTGQSNLLLGEVASRLSSLIEKAFQDEMTQHSAKGKALRMALITKLASDEMMQAGSLVAEKQSMLPTDLLSTAEAAKILGMSRPYVTMLCDSGKLGPVQMTAGGHRKISSGAIENYKIQSTAKHQGASTMREVGLEGHLYDHDDGHYSKEIKRKKIAP